MERAGSPGEARPGTAQDSAREGSADAEEPRPAPAPGWSARHPVLVQLAVLIGFLAAGVVASWPRATYLAGKLPATRDAGAYVWGFWWVPHQLGELANPWFTRSIAARSASSWACTH